MINKKLEKFLLLHPSYTKKGIKYLRNLCYKKHFDISENRPLKDVQDTLDTVKSKIKIPSIKKLEEKYSEKIAFPKFKRLFWDIETSYNVVSTWNVGYKLNIGHENILKERAIICVCYKWAGDNKVHSLQWDNGDDKQLIIDFIEVLNNADEAIGHNSDRFDERWLRTRALVHGISMFPSYKTVDTLKLAKSGFRFNSNRLDYLGKFLGFGGKLDTGGFKLWQEIIMNNCPKAMKKMIDYCKQDVVLLENVYNKLNPYTKAKTHVGVVLGNDKCSCPNCGSENVVKKGTRTSALGVVHQMLQCKDCNKFYQILLATWNKYSKLNMK